MNYNQQQFQFQQMQGSIQQGDQGQQQWHMQENMQLYEQPRHGAMQGQQAHMFQNFQRMPTNASFQQPHQMVPPQGSVQHTQEDIKKQQFEAQQRRLKEISSRGFKNKPKDGKNLVEDFLLKTDLNLSSTRKPEAMKFDQSHRNQHQNFQGCQVSGTGSQSSGAFGNQNFSQTPPQFEVSKSQRSSFAFQPSAQSNSFTFQVPTQSNSSAFQPSAQISSSTFQSPAQISSSTFQPPAQISSSTFQPPAQINSSTFQVPTQSNSSTCQPPAQINSSTFQVPTQSSSSTFQPPAQINSSTFQPFETSAIDSGASSKGSSFDEFGDFQGTDNSHQVQISKNSSLPLFSGLQTNNSMPVGSFAESSRSNSLPKMQSANHSDVFDASVFNLGSQITGKKFDFGSSSQQKELLSHQPQENAAQPINNFSVNTGALQTGSGDLSVAANSAQFHNQINTNYPQMMEIQQNVISGPDQGVTVQAVAEKDLDSPEMLYGSKLPAWCYEADTLPAVYNKVFQKSLALDGSIDTNKLYSLLLSSNVSKEKLKDIWEMANKRTPGVLAKEELNVVLGLIALAQAGWSKLSISKLVSCNSAPIPEFPEYLFLDAEKESVFGGEAISTDEWSSVIRSESPVDPNDKYSVFKSFEIAPASSVTSLERQLSTEPKDNADWSIAGVQPVNSDGFDNWANFKSASNDKEGSAFTTTSVSDSFTHTSAGTTAVGSYGTVTVAGFGSGALGARNIGPTAAPASTAQGKAFSLISSTDQSVSKSTLAMDGSFASSLFDSQSTPSSEAFKSTMPGLAGVNSNQEDLSQAQSFGQIQSEQIMSTVDEDFGDFQTIKQSDTIGSVGVSAFVAPVSTMEISATKTQTSRHLKDVLFDGSILASDTQAKPVRVMDVTKTTGDGALQDVNQQNNVMDDSWDDFASFSSAPSSVPISEFSSFSSAPVSTIPISAPASKLPSLSSVSVESSKPEGNTASMFTASFGSAFDAGITPASIEQRILFDSQGQSTFQVAGDGEFAPFSDFKAAAMEEDAHRMKESGIAPEDPFKLSSTSSTMNEIGFGTHSSSSRQIEAGNNQVTADVSEQNVNGTGNAWLVGGQGSKGFFQAANESSEQKVGENRSTADGLNFKAFNFQDASKRQVDQDSLLGNFAKSSALSEPEKITNAAKPAENFIPREEAKQDLSKDNFITEPALEAENRYKALSGVLEDTDLHVHEWKRFLNSVIGVFNSAASVIKANSLSLQSKKEIFESEKGKQFFNGLKEIYAVTCRVKLSIGKSAFAKSNEEIQTKMKKFDLLWREICAFSSGLPEFKLPESSKPHDIAGGAEAPSAEFLCGLCLLNINKQTIELNGHAISTATLAYGGRTYHSTCANFWCNKVSAVLPSLPPLVSGLL